MKEIKLSKSNLVTLIDDEDFERVSKYKWRIKKDYKSETYFTVRGTVEGKEVYLHRFILGLGKTSLVVDHLDRNTLNNQKSNLRLVTQRENVLNSKRREGSLSYIFIKETPTKTFKVLSNLEGQKKYYGTFSTREDAILARDKELVKIRGNCPELVNDYNYILNTPYPKKALNGSEVSALKHKGIEKPEIQKYPRPSKEELEKLVWSKPTIQIAKEIGCSDKAIEKWCKFYNITKPPRGYWAKLKNNKL